MSRRPVPEKVLRGGELDLSLGGDGREGVIRPGDIEPLKPREVLGVPHRLRRVTIDEIDAWIWLADDQKRVQPLLRDLLEAGRHPQRFHSRGSSGLGSAVRGTFDTGQI